MKNTTANATSNNDRNNEKRIALWQALTQSANHAKNFDNPDAGTYFFKLRGFEYIQTPKTDYFDRNRKTPAYAGKAEYKFKPYFECHFDLWTEQGNELTWVKKWYLKEKGTIFQSTGAVNQLGLIADKNGSDELFDYTIKIAALNAKADTIEDGLAIIQAITRKTKLVMEVTQDDTCGFVNCNIPNPLENADFDEVIKALEDME